MDPFTVTIPATVEALTSDTVKVADLHAATGWELAATVWAWTEGGSKMTHRLSVRGFTELGIRGLCSRNTVRKYRRLWQAAIDEGHACSVEPGDHIVLPDIDLAELLATEEEPEAPPTPTPVEKPELVAPVGQPSCHTPEIRAHVRDQIATVEETIVNLVNEAELTGDEQTVLIEALQRIVNHLRN